MKNDIISVVLENNSLLIKKMTKDVTKSDDIYASKVNK